MVVTAVSITQDLGEKMTATNGVTVGPSRNAGGDSDQASGSSWLRTAPSWPHFTRKLLKGSKVLKVGEPGPLSYLGDNILSPALRLLVAHTGSGAPFCESRRVTMPQAVAGELPVVPGRGA